MATRILDTVSKKKAIAAVWEMKDSTTFYHRRWKEGDFFPSYHVALTKDQFLDLLRILPKIDFGIYDCGDGLGGGLTISKRENVSFIPEYE